MKYKNLFILIALFTFKRLHAQPGSAGWRNNILQSSYVKGETTAPNLLPTQRFTFDKQLNLKLQTTDGRLVDMCLYLNTTEGYMGVLPPSGTGAGPIVDILPELPDFSFIVFGVNGTAYRYYNNPGSGGVMKKRVSTFNTDLVRYEYSNTAGSNILQNRGEPRNYYDGQVTGATAYMYDWSTAKLFLYGNSYPQALHVTRYLGNFGIGYLQTTEGTYLVFERQDFEDYYKIKAIETTVAFFNAADYTVVEEEYIQKRTADLEKERIKIAKDEAGLRSGNCISERTNYVDWRKRNWRQQQENLFLSTTGNLFQSREAQLAMLGTMDPLLIVQESIYKTRISLCNNQTAFSRSPANRVAERKIPCLQNTIIELQNQEAALRAIDTRLASSPGAAFAEKSRYYMRHLPRGCD